MHLRKQVRAFAELMETRLRRHDKKRGDAGWRTDCEGGYLLHRLFEELGEAFHEIDPRDEVGRYLIKVCEDYFIDSMPLVMPKHPDKLTLEMGDVANFLMMLTDITDEDFSPDEDDEDKIEVAMTREQWNDIINLRGVVIGSTGQKALLDLARALGATCDTSQWPDAEEER